MPVRHADKTRQRPSVHLRACCVYCLISWLEVSCLLFGYILTIKQFLQLLQDSCLGSLYHGPPLLLFPGSVRLGHTPCICFCDACCYPLWWACGQLTLLLGYTAGPRLHRVTGCLISAFRICDPGIKAHCIMDSFERMLPRDEGAHLPGQACPENPETVCGGI